MRIVLNLDCDKPENFTAALSLFKALKYPASHHKKTIGELTREIFFGVDLEATHDEFSRFVKMDAYQEKAE